MRDRPNRDPRYDKSREIRIRFWDRAIAQVNRLLRDWLEWEPEVGDRAARWFSGLGYNTAYQKDDE